ncbi:MAG: class I SAM-dependent methyltransferase [Euryarchaeota archaeon]|nr:class I SAM-dependent methyltransferase [Euryarchaeota archaeon]
MRPLSKKILNDTAKVRARYDRISYLYDIMELPTEKLLFSAWRKKLFQYINGGKILEIGVGTGKNLRYYPMNIEAIAIDFSKKMLERAKRKAEKGNIKVDLKEMDAQKLEFRDNSFNTVFATFVYCSVPDPIKGLQEIRRVCKPDGKVILLEHVRPRSFIGRVFDLLNPLIVRMTGVNINRNTVENAKKAGLEVIREENLFLDIVKFIIVRPIK